MDSYKKEVHEIVGKLHELLKQGNPRAGLNALTNLAVMIYQESNISYEEYIEVMNLCWTYYEDKTKGDKNA